MVAKQKKPTKEEIKKNEAIINAINFCIYPASFADRTIDIPQDELEEGSEELSVRFLIREYGFKVQSVIPGTVKKKEHFNPEIKTVKTATSNNDTSIELPKRGDIWIKGEERIYFKDVKEKVFEITYLNSLVGNKTVTKSSIESLILNGILVKEPPR